MRDFMDIANKVESAFKSFHRGGIYLKKVFEKPEKIITANEMLFLHNTYGIPCRELVLLILSHDFEMEKDAFILLVKMQEEQIKNSKPC